MFVENDLHWYICIIHLDENNKLSVDSLTTPPWLKVALTARITRFLGFEPRKRKELTVKAMEAFQQETY